MAERKEHMILKTEDLQKQGLNQEQINYVMAVVGKEVNALASERDNYKTQLVTAQQTLKSFEGVNVQELRGEIAKLTAGYGDQRRRASETDC